MMNKWYRYETSTLDEYGGVKLRLLIYKVIKKTPCGVWLSLYPFYPKKWVKKNSRRKFACPTKVEALESFIARKRRQIEILNGQLSHTKKSLIEAELLKSKEAEK